MLGSFPGPNARTTAELENWMHQINNETSNPWAFNMITHKSYDRFSEELDLIKKFQPKIVITAGLYMICTLSKHEAEAKGYSDALMLDYRGQIAEATGANIFFKMPDGKLHTPLADCFLDGITRRTVMKLAKDHGVDIVERKIMPEEMADAEECFLTGTAAEVTPVQSIGDYKFKPGDLCFKLTRAYSELVNNH